MSILATEEKECSICKKVKPLANFPNNRAAKDGKQARCKPCDTKYLRAWNLANPERRAEAQRERSWRQYGLTPDDYYAMLEAQGEVCVICQRKQVGKNRYLAVDETGKVRGLLCNPCNTALGLLRDDADLLLRATRYLNDCLN